MRACRRDSSPENVGHRQGSIAVASPYPMLSTRVLSPSPKIAAIMVGVLAVSLILFGAFIMVPSLPSKPTLQIRSDNVDVQHYDSSRGTAGPLCKSLAHQTISACSSVRTSAIQEHLTKYAFMRGFAAASEACESLALRTRPTTTEQYARPDEEVAAVQTAVGKRE